jgi:hypothetical protein
MATATMARRNQVCLIEQEMQTASRGVDRKAGIIRGVRVLGPTSKNGREYTLECLRAAVPLYEDCKVRVNHPDKRTPNIERGVEDTFGTLRRARIGSDGAIYADLHYIKSHPLAEQITEAAERFPNQLGLSPHSYGVTSTRGGKTIVESIDRVESVDLVDKPATNAGLFESVGTPAAGMQLSSMESSVIEVLRSNGSKAEKLSLIRDLLDTFERLAKRADASFSSGDASQSSSNGDPDTYPRKSIAESLQRGGGEYESIRRDLNASQRRPWALIESAAEAPPTREEKRRRDFIREIKG